MRPSTIKTIVPLALTTLVRTCLESDLFTFMIEEMKSRNTFDLTAQTEKELPIGDQLGIGLYSWIVEEVIANSMWGILFFNVRNEP